MKVFVCELIVPLVIDEYQWYEQAELQQEICALKVVELLGLARIDLSLQIWKSNQDHKYHIKILVDEFVVRLESQLRNQWTDHNFAQPNDVGPPPPSPLETEDQQTKMNFCFTEEIIDASFSFDQSMTDEKSVQKHEHREHQWEHCQEQQVEVVRTPGLHFKWVDDAEHLDRIVSYVLCRHQRHEVEEDLVEVGQEEAKT